MTDQAQKDLSENLKDFAKVTELYASIEIEKHTKNPLFKQKRKLKQLTRERRRQVECQEFVEQKSRFI